MPQLKSSTVRFNNGLLNAILLLFLKHAVGITLLMVFLHIFILAYSFFVQIGFATDFPIEVLLFWGAFGSDSSLHVIARLDSVVAGSFGGEILLDLLLI